MILGITGGSGSGKTTLLSCAKEAGCLILDCDVLYHELLRTDQALQSAIASRFPGTVENGLVDRKKLGNWVFSDEKALQDLNSLTHSAVKAEVLRRLHSWNGHAAIDAYALFESGLDSLCDVTVAVLAPAQVRINRLVQRDQITPEYAQKRIAAQHSDQWFREKCDYCLENRENFDAFATKCLAFLKEIGIIIEEN